MAIEFNCPSCGTFYRLKDEVAGKSAKCKNEACRKVMTIPRPKPAPAGGPGSDTPPPSAPVPPPKPAVAPPPRAVAPPATKPAAAPSKNVPANGTPMPAAPPSANGNGSVPPSAKPAAPKPAVAQKPPVPPKPVPPPPAPPTPVDFETLAMNALSDDAPAKDEPPPEVRVVPMTCAVCEHKWEEPAAKAGKNVLCPECQTRQKVPEPKHDAPRENWREQRSKGPSMAKPKEEKLEGVQDAHDTKGISDETARELFADEDVEDIPLRTKLLRYAAVAGVVLLVVVGVWSRFSTRTIDKADRTMADAVKEWDGAAAEEKPPAAEAPLFAAALQLAAGEYALRNAKTEDDGNLKSALDHFTSARDHLWLRKLTPAEAKVASTQARDALTCELAAATLDLGGTPEQVTARTRHKWAPELQVGRSLRINEREVTVLTELQRTLQVVGKADMDLRVALARRLTRELIRRGQVEAARQLDVQLFDPADHAEAQAVVALELYRADKASPVARQMAEKLKDDLTPKGRQAAPKHNPIPSVFTLWKVLEIEPPKGMSISLPPASPQARPAADVRLAHVGLYTLQGKVDEATKLALRPGTLGDQLRTLALIADWTTGDEQAKAFDAVPGVLAMKSSVKADLVVPPFVLLRLVQLAAQAGKQEQAKDWAARLADDGLREWAKAEAVRGRLGAAATTPADPLLVEAPDDPKKMKVGQAWGRLHVARHNARLSGDRQEGKKLEDWPKGSVRPFGYAGVALGLQDR